MGGKTRRPGELPPLPKAAPPSAPPSAPPEPKLEARLEDVPAATPPPALPPDPIIGRLISDRYRISAEIGAGGMATVYRAEHQLLHKPVAVKVLLPELAIDDQMAARFEREAIAAARLDHPNCVTVTDFGRTDDKRLFLVMEYLEGKVLADLAGHGRRLPWDRAVELARQILRGMGHAHEMGIVHRDLKPSNVMLITHPGGREVAKIIDFGIAKIFDGSHTGPSVETQTGIVFGTADFLAPERLLGLGDADPRSDLYSVGVVLYEMLTGERPFHAEDPYVIVKRALGEVPRPPTEVAPDANLPPILETAVLRALEKDPEKRFQTAREFLAALDPLSKKSSGSGILIPPAAAAAAAPEPAAGATPGLSPVARRRLRIGLGIAAAVFLLAIIIGSVTRQGTRPPEGSPTATGSAQGDQVTDLVKLAADGATPADRQRAFDQLIALGYGDKIPWVPMLEKDLVQLPTCEERREIVTRMRKLNDPAFLPSLNRAMTRADNGCLTLEARAGVVSLGGLPATAPSSEGASSARKRPAGGSGGGGGGGGGGHF